MSTEERRKDGRRTGERRQQAQSDGQWTKEERRQGSRRIGPRRQQEPGSAGK